MVASISDSDLRALIMVKDFQLYGINVKELLNIIKPDNPFELVTVPKTQEIGSVLFYSST